MLDVAAAVIDTMSQLAHPLYSGFTRRAVTSLANLAGYAQPPDPGGGVAPPGAEKIQLLLQWVAWIVFTVCVAGVFIVAGRMAIMHQRGQGGEHAAGLGWVLGACILGGAASSIVGMLI